MLSLISFFEKILQIFYNYLFIMLQQSQKLQNIGIFENTEEKYTIQGLASEESLKIRMETLNAKGNREIYGTEIKNMNELGILSQFCPTFKDVINYMKIKNRMLQINQQKKIIVIKGVNPTNDYVLVELAKIKFQLIQVKARTAIQGVISRCNQIAKLGGDEIKSLFLYLLRQTNDYKQMFKNIQMNQQNIKETFELQLKNMREKYIQIENNQKNESIKFKQQIEKQIKDIHAKVQNMKLLEQSKQNEKNIKDNELSSINDSSIELKQKIGLEETEKMKQTQQIAQKIQQLADQLKKNYVKNATFKKIKIIVQKLQQQYNNTHELPKSKCENLIQLQLPKKVEDSVIKDEKEIDQPIIVQKTPERVKKIQPINAKNWIDLNCYFYNFLSIQNNTITNNRSQFVNIFGNLQLNNKNNSFSFQILTMKSSICIGLVDRSYKHMSQLRNQKNHIYYSNNKKKCWDKSLNRRINNKCGSVDWQKASVEWKFGFQSIHSKKLLEIKYSNIKWVPYIQLVDKNDSIKIIP